MAMSVATPSYAGEVSGPRSILPDKYRDPDLSGLSCQIKPGLDNLITLRLE
jgi:hypothetical protein